MNVYEYVNERAHKLAAAVTAYIATDPTIQNALLAKQSVNEVAGPMLPAVQAAAMLYDVVSFTLDATAPPVTLLGGITDLVRDLAHIPGYVPDFDRLVNMGLDGMQEYDDFIDHMAEVISGEFRGRGVPEFSRSEVDQPSTDETERLEAEWKKAAGVAERASEQARRDADKKIEDQRIAALEKDDARKAEQTKTESPELSKEARDQELRDGENQAELSAVHAEQAARQDQQMETLKEQLSERYKDASEEVRKEQLDKFDARAEAVKEARADRQAEEMRELVEQQARELAARQEEDLNRSR